MAPNQADGQTAHIGARVPVEWKAALKKLAEARSPPHTDPDLSPWLRDAVIQYLARADDLPPEEKDSLDEDLLANAGGENFEEELEEELEEETDGGVEA